MEETHKSSKVSRTPKTKKRYEIGWLESLELSESDKNLGKRMQSGEIISDDGAIGGNSFYPTVDPFVLRKISEDPDAYQKLICDIDAVIKKNILDWHGEKEYVSPRFRPRTVILGGFKSLQCSRCLSLNPPYGKYCMNCGARFGLQ